MGNPISARTIEKLADTLVLPTPPLPLIIINFFLIFTKVFLAKTSGPSCGGLSAMLIPLKFI
ncbi:hypothetical protein QUF90_26195 [Desulfococcaceae bacterium HSG9]|nr:hypothetical protein [Desulfococcaceae bacterium HSG9]